MSIPFRESALAHAQTAEGLDELMTVIRPHHWVALLGALAMMVLLTAWTLVGEVPVQVKGRGILLSGSGIREVQVDHDCRVQELLVRPGDKVHQGQTLARLEPLTGGPIEELVSPWSGTVLETFSAGGQLLRGESDLLSLGSDTALQAELFLAPELGSRVKVGMEAHILPDIVASERYGFLPGKVVFVAPYPSSRRGLSNLLGDDHLIDDWMSAGAPLRISVELEVERGTRTGYRWSTGTQPPLALRTGILVSGHVVLRRTTPARLLFDGLGASNS